MMNTNELIQAENLQELAAEAKATQRPLLLLFTQEHCDYCHRLKDEIYKPMMMSADERQRVMILELSIDPGTTITDFDGNSTEGFMIFKDYELVVTPTALLLDSNGVELYKPMLGANTLEMYGWYLDIAIDEARTKISA